jgi:hypothetical protein
MALTPISLFQAQGSGIAQFLQGGQNALASALNNVIQVGRDTANNQFAQERDFLGERKRMEDLMQRRGEVAMQQANTDRTFARGVFESDRQFADVNADQARQEQRQMAMDLFNRKESNRDFGLRREAADLAMDQRRQKEQFSRDILAQPSATGAAPSRMSADFLYGPVAGTPAAPPMTGTTPEPAAPTAAGSIEERLAQAEIRALAAQQVGNAPAFTAATGEAARLRGELRRLGIGTEGMTPAQILSRERLDIYNEDRMLRQQEAAEKKTTEAAEQSRKEATENFQLMVNADPVTFPTAGSYVPSSMPKEAREAALAQAQARDANRPAVELQAALDSKNADDYVAKMVAPAKWEKDKWVPKTAEEIQAEIASIPQSVKDKRRKAWSDARKTGREGAEASTAEPTAGEPASTGKVLGYDIRQPYESELRFFKERPEVAGMAAEDGKIVLNPFSSLSKEQKSAVALNEAYRLKMSEQGVKFGFDITPEQRKAFEGTEYAKDDDALRQTIVARVLSGDSSAKATKQQTDAAEKFKQSVSSGKARPAAEPTSNTSGADWINNALKGLD